MHRHRMLSCLDTVLQCDTRHLRCGSDARKKRKGWNHCIVREEETESGLSCTPNAKLPRHRAESAAHGTCAADPTRGTGKRNGTIAS